MADAKNPPSFHDAIADAAQAIAGSINAPDYDPKFAGMIIDVMHKFVTMPKAGQGQAQPPAGGNAQPPAGGPGAPSPDPTSQGAGAPGGVGGPTSDTGSAPPGGGAQTPPAAPTPGGMTQGLTPSPDELRRVLSDVAGK
jgi:hypothetical protein